MSTTTPETKPEPKNVPKTPAKKRTKKPSKKVESAIEEEVIIESTEDKQELEPEEETRTNQEQLFDLYTANEADSALDMTKLDQHFGKRNVVLLFATVILILSGVAAFLGYMVFGTARTANSTGGMEVSVVAPETVASGDELSITINYKNTMNSTIETGALEVLYPQGFYPATSQPDAAEGTDNRWIITDVPAGASGSITITGQMVGQAEDTKNFTALLTYSPSNFNSEFQTTERWSVTVNKSILDLTVTVPDRIRTGEEFEYAFEVKNTASLPLTNVRTKLVSPASFTTSSIEPAATTNDDTWEYKEFAAGSSEKVAIKGAISAEGGTDQEFILQVGIVEPSGVFNLQAELPVTIRVVNPELEFEVTAPTSAVPGEELTYSVKVKNTAESSVEQLELQLAFTEGAFEVQEVVLPIIDEIQPGQTQTVEYKATVADPLPSGLGKITAEASVVSATVEGRSVDFDQTSKVETAIQGGLQATVSARYFSDDLTKVGSGPLPPKQGETTTYKITAEVQAEGSGLTNVQLILSLPDHVVAANIPAGSTTEGNALTIPLDNIAAGDSASVTFSLEATPRAKQVGKLLVLILSGVVNATDANSDAALQTELSAVTAKLTDDPGFSSGDETVVGKE